MSTQRVQVFFYGSYMNTRVLAEVDLKPAKIEPARLLGFQIVIRPLANLKEDAEGVVFGVLADASHAELERLYAHARDVLGGTYLPQAVITHTQDDRLVPALCYVAPEMPERPPAKDYVERIVAAARQFGFPATYIAKLQHFSKTAS